eukprot:scaffold8569_cov139-Cylindrotheca_fusiformis.AAC.12
MILFESPTRNHGAGAPNPEFRRSLAKSLEPLQRKYPSIVPAPAQTSFSLGLQPHLEHQGNNSNVMQASVNPSLLYAATIAPHSVSFLKILFAFISGGLFFSTALAGIASCYAFGVDNVKRFIDISLVILQKVWITFTLGLGATKLALLGGDKDESLDDVSKRVRWQWKSAWEVLKEQLRETRQTAARGVEALRQEAKLYTAAVGAPGLIPLQYTLDRLMPLGLATILEDAVKDSLRNMPKQPTIRKITLSSFDIGSMFPVLEAARVYDVDNAIAFDYDVRWRSELEATVKVHTALARVPVVLKNLNFRGVMRVVLTPLTKTPPGYGAMLLSFPTTPKISFDIRILGSEIPFLKQEITNAIYKTIDEEWIWPKRNVFPSMKNGGQQPILSRQELLDLKSTDPLLEAQETLRAQQPMLKSFDEKTENNEKKQKKNMLSIGVDDETEESSSNDQNGGCDWLQHIAQIFQPSKKNEEDQVAVSETNATATDTNMTVTDTNSTATDTNKTVTDTNMTTMSDDVQGNEDIVDMQPEDIVDTQPSNDGRDHVAHQKRSFFRSFKRPFQREEQGVAQS